MNVVLTENDAQDESDDESEEEIPSASAIKTSIEQLEAQVVAMQFFVVQ